MANRCMKVPLYIVIYFSCYSLIDFMLVGRQELLKLFIMWYWYMHQNDFLFSKCNYYCCRFIQSLVCFFFRNEAYIACIRLAVLDYSAHAEQPVVRNKEGNIVYHRKYRKQTKKWDTAPVRCPKMYSYMDDLVADIIRLREKSDQTTRSKVTLPSNHPRNLQLTIGHVPPPETSEILSTKQSRF